jgi:hypothetical protein
MKLLKSIIDGKRLEITRSFFGNEKVFINGQLVSQKQNFLGANHRIHFGEKHYELKYTVKDAWKRITGKPVIQINSNGVFISENPIKNRSYFAIQFFVGLTIMYCAYLIIMMLLESARNGFVHYAY